MKTLTFAVVACVLCLFAATAAGSGSACTVTPDPVTLGVDTSFTVTAAGAIPGERYEVTDQQQGHHKQDEDRVWLGQADANGDINATVPVQDGRLGYGKPYALWPGDVSVKVIHYQQGGGSTTSKGASQLASCSFTVNG